VTAKGKHRLTKKRSGGTYANPVDLGGKREIEERSFEGVYTSWRNLGIKTDSTVLFAFELLTPKKSG